MNKQTENSSCNFLGQLDEVPVFYSLNTLTYTLKEEVTGDDMTALWR